VSVSLLLDTRVLLWWLSKPMRLSAAARRAIATEPTVYVSAATTWEITIKRAAHKLQTDVDLIAEIAHEGFQHLPITLQHGILAGTLEPHHQDPFDRILIAQAIADELVLVTTNPDISKYDIRVLAA
jgi:PIN domain nuclease of toxin-antitoxin system